MIKQCVICFESFLPRHGNYKTCSSKCRDENERRVRNAFNNSPKQRAKEKIRRKAKPRKFTPEQREKIRIKAREKYRSLTPEQKEKWKIAGDNWRKNNPDWYKRYRDRNIKASRIRYVKMKAAMEICKELGMEI